MKYPREQIPALALSTVSCLAIVSAARVTAAMASMGIKIYSVNASFPHGQPL